MTKKQWLIAAAVFHILVTVGVFVLGHYRIASSVFDEFGTGIAFASDGLTYRNLAQEIAFRWQTYGIGAWLDTQAPLHLRLYMLFFRILGPLLGYNILAVEPLNALLYVCILSLVYLLAKEIFDARVGMISAVIVALWPTFLIHSTQLLRDPLWIICMLALVLLLAMLLTRNLSVKQCALVSLTGLATLVVLWLARGNMWNVIIVFQLITAVLLLVRIVRERKFNWNVPVLLFFIGASLVIPGQVESMTIGGLRPPKSPLAISESVSGPGDTWQRLIRQLGERRAGFRVYGPQASNIDTAVRLDNTGAVVRYLPRATVIGVFAPFPQLWVEAGKVGHMGRLISGVETLLMYFCYAFALVCLWHERRRVAVWLPVLAALAGMVLLGLVVVNVGALFRLRYIFWILLIPVGVKGLVITAETLRARRKTQSS
jgi:hypothetical protein